MTGRAACRSRKPMAALAFDTYKAVKALREAGADELLAEAVVATVGEAVSGNVATKADIAEVQAALKAEMAAVKTEMAEVKAELKADIAEVKAEFKTDLAEVKTEIAEVRAELKTDLAALESRLHRQLWVMAAGIVGLTVALVKLTA